MNKPNIILISIDTLRADHLSCYGHNRKTSPHLDNLCTDGVLYEKAYSTAVWTPPAHASMLTGLCSSHHGVVDDNRLNKDIPTIAEVLSKSGYKTAGFVNNSQVGELVGLERGHEMFVEVWKGTGGKSIYVRGMDYVMRNVRKVFGINDHGAHRTNQLAQKWMKENDDRPFYVFLHYIEPHNPIDAPHPFKTMFMDKEKDKRIDRSKLQLVAHNPLVCYTNNITLNEEEIKALKALYDGEVSYIDHKIGELLDFLKRNNLYDNTMVIITADHGEHFGEHGLYSHVASLFEPVLHIPLIIKYPENKEGGTRKAVLVQLTDIFPTVVDVAGIKEVNSNNLEGKSLCVIEKDSPFHKYIIAEWEGRVPYFVLERVKNVDSSDVIKKFKEPMVMIRDERYKYISHSNGNCELFDLNRDEGEVNNIAEQNGEACKRLSESLRQWRSTQSKVKIEKQTIDEITKKNLESLGYM